MIARTAIVDAARGWIGTPYRHQASLKGVGCDCLGLVRGVWREVVGDEPEPLRPYAQDWPLASAQEPLLALGRTHFRPCAREAIGPGDVLVFRWRTHLPASHLAIATSETTMAHAHDGAAVAEVALSPWWRRRLAGAFSFPGLAD